MTFAQEAVAADAETERARALFEEAGELERHGQWGAAQERLRAALRLRETPQLYYALGWALENDDKLLEAKAEYETTIRAGRERPNPGAEEAVRLAAARLADLEKKMPIVKVRLVGAPHARATTHVIVDGREIKRGDDDVAITPVNPGSHVIRVERGADGAIEQMVYVGRGTVRTIDVDAGAAPEAAIGATRDTAQDRHAKPLSVATTKTPTAHKPNVVPWVLLSGGVALIAGSTALLLSASSDADKRDENQSKWCAATACTGGVTATRPETAEAASYRQEASDATSSGNTKQAFGLALGGVGIVSAAVGTILLVRGEDDRVEERPSRSRSGSRVRANAAPITGGAFGTVGFAF